MHKPLHLLSVIVLLLNAFSDMAASFPAYERYFNLLFYCIYISFHHLVTLTVFKLLGLLKLLLMCWLFNITKCIFVYKPE